MPAKVDNNRCTGCEACLESCPSEAIKMDNGKAKVERDACVDCAVCVGECPVEAIGME
jgi:ferredoxin